MGVNGLRLPFNGFYPVNSLDSAQIYGQKQNMKFGPLVRIWVNMGTVKIILSQKAFSLPRFRLFD